MNQKIKLVNGKTPRIASKVSHKSKATWTSTIDISTEKISNSVSRIKIKNETLCTATSTKLKFTIDFTIPTICHILPQSAVRVHIIVIHEATSLILNQVSHPESTSRNPHSTLRNSAQSHSQSTFIVKLRFAFEFFIALPLKWFASLLNVICAMHSIYKSVRVVSMYIHTYIYTSAVQSRR